MSPTAQTGSKSMARQVGDAPAEIVARHDIAPGATAPRVHVAKRLDHQRVAARHPADLGEGPVADALHLLQRQHRQHQVDAAILERQGRRISLQESDALEGGRIAHRQRREIVHPPRQLVSRLECARRGHPLVGQLDPMELDLRKAGGEIDEVHAVAVADLEHACRPQALDGPHHQQQSDPDPAELVGEKEPAVPFPRAVFRHRLRQVVAVALVLAPDLGIFPLDLLQSALAARLEAAKHPLPQPPPDEAVSPPHLLLPLGIVGGDLTALEWPEEIGDLGNNGLSPAL